MSLTKIIEDTVNTTPARIVFYLNAEIVGKKNAQLKTVMTEEGLRIDAVVRDIPKGLTYDKIVISTNHGHIKTITYKQDMAIGLTTSLTIEGVRQIPVLEDDKHQAFRDELKQLMYKYNAKLFADTKIYAGFGESYKKNGAELSPFYVVFPEDI